MSDDILEKLKNAEVDVSKTYKGEWSDCVDRSWIHAKRYPDGSGEFIDSSFIHWRREDLIIRNINEKLY